MKSSLHLNELEDALAQEQYFKSHKLHFLVIDDNEVFLRFMNIALSKMYPGAVVEVLRNGEEATHYMLHHYPPDLIILDINMPKLNGITTAKVMEAISLRPIPVIFVSANAHAHRDIAATFDFTQGRHFFMAKPIELTSLKSLIGQVLPGKREAANF